MLVVNRLRSIKVESIYLPVVISQVNTMIVIFCSIIATITSKTFFTTSM